MLDSVSTTTLSLFLHGRLRHGAVKVDPRAAARHSAASRAGAVCALLLVLLCGCATGGSGNPVLRSLGWFNYLDGTDIREGCAPGSPDRYRLVYNAVWGEQVRDYEITTDPATGAARLDARILFPEAPSQIDLRDPLRSFHGRRGSALLTPSETQVLAEDLRRSGFHEPAPAGLILPSDGYYWVVAACMGGAYHFNAWRYPSPRFAALRFPAFLFAHDTTGAAVRPPGPSAPRGPENRVTRETRTYSVFDLKVGTNGLVGIPSL